MNKLLMVSVVLFLFSSLLPAGLPQNVDDEVKNPISEQHDRLVQEQGRTSWKAQLDYTMGRIDPLTGEKSPKYIAILGESTSQMILGGRFLLTRSRTQGKKSAEYQILGYRSDLNQYFFVGLESLRTPFGYRSGRYVDDDRILKDPSGYVTEITRFDSEKKTAVSKVYLGESKTPFFVLNTEPKKGKVSNLLTDLLAAKPIPKVISTSDTLEEPAENYSEEHQLLNKFAGDLVAESEEVSPRAGRVICDGRFLALSKLSDAKEKRVTSLTFIGFDSSRGAFQMFVFHDESPNPEYYEGDFDGVTLTFRNPFAGQGKADQPVLIYHFSPRGAGFTESDFREDDEEKRQPVLFKQSRNFRRK